MRSASASAEKPPKTIEWMAPMRAQASIGNGEFGDHGHIDRDAVAFFYASRFEHVGKFADLLVQFTVGEFGVFTRFVAFPDNGDLISSIREVTVNAVVRDVGFGPFKPLDKNWPIVHIVVVGPHGGPIFCTSGMNWQFQPRMLRDRQSIFRIVSRRHQYWGHVHWC